MTIWYSCGRTKYQLTIPMDKNNVGAFTLALGFSRFQAFCAEGYIDPSKEDMNPLSLLPSIQDHWIEEEEPMQLKSRPMEVDFSLQGPPTLGQEFTKEVEEAVLTEASVDFLRYHQMYGVISPLRIQAMAKRGILPRGLATYPVSVYTACFYGKSTKKSWRSKPSDEDREAKNISIYSVITLNSYSCTKDPHFLLTMVQV